MEEGTDIEAVNPKLFHMNTDNTFERFMHRKLCEGMIDLHEKHEKTEKNKPNNYLRKQTEMSTTENAS